MTNSAGATTDPLGGRRRRLAAIGVFAPVVAVASLLTVTATSTTAAADTVPISPTIPETVSADALPTVQINGVVWDQVIVGNRVYATGQFSQARPAGAAPGTNETPRAQHPRLRPHHRAADHQLGPVAQRAGHGAGRLG